MMAESSLETYIHSEFTKRFGDNCNIETLPLPHEAIVKIQVSEISSKMEEFVQALEAEFTELSRQVSIHLQVKKL
jgi:hypothetical protein